MQAHTTFYTTPPTFRQGTNPSTEDISYDPKRRLSTESFRDQQRWKSLRAKSGEYDGWGNTSICKPWICFTVWRAVWGRELWCCRCTPEDDRQRRFLRIAGLRWCRVLSLHITASQSVGLLWTRNQCVAETSSWQHTTLTTDIHVPGGIRPHNLSRRAAVNLCLYAARPLWSALYYITILYYTILYYTILYYTILHNIPVFNWMTLYI